MIVFSPQLIKAVCEHARKTYPNECCGILLGERDDKGCRTVKEVYETNNLAKEKMQKNHFVISTDEILYAELIAAKNDYEIVGFYHSHTDCGATASEEDSNYAIQGISYPIVSVENGQIKELFSWEKTWTNVHEDFVREIIKIKTN